MRAKGEAARVLASAWGTMRLRACRDAFPACPQPFFHRVVHNFSPDVAIPSLVHYCGSLQDGEAKGPEMFRIFPSVPITWRSSSCIQFGADDPVLIDGLLPGDACLMLFLVVGIVLFDFVGNCVFYC